MSKLLSVLFLSLSFTLFSCSHETKVIAETYPDGSPKRECVYKGKKESRELVRETTWYPNKNVQMTGEYKKGKRDGHWVYYYENGNIWSEGFFKEGKSDGKRTTHYEDGKVRYEAFYQLDRRVGTWKFYDETGKLEKTVTYPNPQEK